MTSLEQSGGFGNVIGFLKSKSSNDNPVDLLDKLGKKGVEMLSENTPVDTGRTASSWGYKIVKNNGSYELIWTNDNMTKNIPIALLLQYGHATSGGGYVPGVDYINPALSPLFDDFADDVGRGSRK